jgi:hypothetical protein
MDGVNHGLTHSDEVLGDGEVINGDQSGVKYPFAFIRDGEDLRWWEYKISDHNNFLVRFTIHIVNIFIITAVYYLYRYTTYTQEIPKEFSFIFFNKNQQEIKLIDQENGERYSCDMHFSMKNIDDIYVGNGWSDYVKRKELKKGALVFLPLFGDNPHNLHVIVLERD